ncbi:MAG: hypothetical protein JXQ27_17650 [Acidobacteria bacterium]|nr:hypothetical protein [Acidobacteriota bacterium]
MRFKLLIALLVLLVPMVYAGMVDHAAAHNQIRKMDPEIARMITGLKTNLVQTYGVEKAFQDKMYIGTEYCIACHTWSTRYRDTGHAMFLQRLVAGQGNPIAEAIVQGVDFNQMTGTAFDAYKPNAPILFYQDGKFWMTIGDVTYEIVFLMAQDRFVVRIPVTDTGNGWSHSPYFSPVRYSGGDWSAYNAGDWYNTDNTPKWTPATTSADLAGGGPRNYSSSCAGCHITGIRELGYAASGEFYMRPFPASLYMADDPRYFDYDGDGIFDMVNIGCESCHGGGSLHVLGAGDPEKIIAPSNLEPMARTNLCGRCHAKVRSVPNGMVGFPFNDETMTDLTPDLIAQGFGPHDFGTPATRFWPDGENPSYSYQWDEYILSSKPFFQFHMVYCTECHSPHSKRQSGQIRTSIEGIPTAVDDNTLCLACHATHGAFADITTEQVADYEANLDHIAKVVAAHTNHPYAPERMMGLSRCTYCHMANVAGHASHTFEAISPQKTMIYQDVANGMPNSCALACHAALVNLWGLGIDTNNVWNDAFDIATAEILQQYYGPGGIWWDHDVLEKAHK